ncbi:hypothetical protein ASPCAL06320 [Aspergillus calidoustus]|uniref:Uncharacterized protein n=1 Tax=Aspergillus calidoustus TaxID=454130 RepID=A0A0U5G019_ASPCI|nr:hypothetical protein ASPCAL06320 [Aspergillus calidoustus]
MRPALLRFLKRPSALSVIDSLISSPSGIEHLRSGLSDTCTRCQASSSTQQTVQHPESWPSSDDTTKPSSFRVHVIRSAPNSPTRDNRPRTPAGWNKLALQTQRLDDESDVGATDGLGTRLVDDPLYKNDFSLWLEVLRYRERRYGYKGTLDVWKGLMARVPGGLELPVDGQYADVFWQSFVDLGLKRETLLVEVTDYALDLWKRTGKRWPNLYQSIVGRFVQCAKRSQALKWHTKLQDRNLTDPSDLVDCFQSAFSDFASSGEGVSGAATAPGRPLAWRLSAFREVCRHTNGHRIYSQVISALIAKGELTEAIRMHKFLVERGDHPQSHEELEPFLELAKDFNCADDYAELRKYYIHFKTQHTTNETKISDVSISEDQFAEPDANEWIKEKPFNDEFGARIFATQALRFDMILSGLKMFSVQAIGPRSLREMAIRARGCHDLHERITRLQQEGISIGNSIFAQLLSRLAKENREILLSDLLQSDQHPDMLQDVDMQERLLVSYYEVRDWRQYNLTSAILKELHGEGSRELMNIHARKHLACGELALASKVIDDMLTQGFSPTRKTTEFMATHILTPRRVGGGPVRQGDLHFAQELAFVFRFLQRIAQADAHIPPKLWVELLKRLGMTDSWNELRKCCLWLARHYSSSRTWLLPCDHPPLNQAHGEQMLETIFTEKMQDAIVAWGFIIQPPNKVHTYTITGPDGEQLAPFVRGLMLLRELQQTGVPIRLSRVIKVCEQRLVMLYGPPKLSNRPKNRQLRQENPYVFERVVADLNRAWGKPHLIDEQGTSRLYRKIKAIGPARPTLLGN